jgi:hypothetical protein
VAGIGGIAPGKRDLSRRRDRQAAWVLVAAGATALLFFIPLALVLGALASLYAYAVRALRPCVAGAVVMGIACLSVILGVGDGWTGGLAT